MWISAAFGLTSKFSECMLAIKYREINAKGEMSGGPMYTMKKALKNKKIWGGSCVVICTLCCDCFVWNRQYDTGKFDFRCITYDISCAGPSDRNCDYGACPADHCRRYQIHFKGFFGGRSADGVFYVICGVIVIIGNISNLPAGGYDCCLYDYRTCDCLFRCPWHDRCCREYADRFRCYNRGI